MGGKNSAKRKGKKSGKPQQGQARSGSSAGNDFRGAGFAGSQVLGHGTMTANTYVQQYAPVPTALDALPQPPVGFTGREDDLAYILGVLKPDRSGEGPAVAVLSGGGGVGKTTLAYAAGHAAQRSGWFTGVLLVDLHGYDPQPAQAEEALEALLRSLGVPHEHLPPPGAGRDVLYRSQLNARQEKGQRLLVVADNASAIAQVQPLMPPGHHGMLVTSRQRLTGLGRMRTVNRLQPEDAVALLEAALKNNDPDDPRVGQDPAAAERLVSACDYLPLALQITAALLAQDPGQPLSERADALGGAEGVLDGLDDGERSLRTTFDQSLERLTPQEQDLFRLLALNPGPDISTPAAAILADQSQPATERLLARLAASHLIERTPAARDRWQMHDLLRAYAQKQAAAVMDRGRTPRRRYDQARDRLTHHYIQHAQAANTHLDPTGSPVSARFTDRDQALAWFDAERENLMATAHTTPQAALDLSFALGSYLRWRQRLQDHVVVRALALDACTKLNDTRNRATVWNNLGGALQELRRFDDALHALETALALYQQTGDTNGEASAWNNLGNTLKALRRFDDALHAHQTARNLHQPGTTSAAYSKNYAASTTPSTLLRPPATSTNRPATPTAKPVRGTASASRSRTCAASTTPSTPTKPPATSTNRPATPTAKPSPGTTSAARSRTCAASTTPSTPTKPPTTSTNRPATPTAKPSPGTTSALRTGAWAALMRLSWRGSRLLRCWRRRGTGSVRVRRGARWPPR
nr:tetratricopeptide repeat protein [Streptomyces sp. NRRL F-3218]